MRHLSTRGGEALSLAGAMAAGVPADGGAFVPERWPLLPSEEIEALASATFAEVAARILTAFADHDLAPEVLDEAAADAAASLAHVAGAPLAELYPNVWLAERFHGPSHTPSDFEMQGLARLYRRAGVARTVVLRAGPEARAAVQAFAVAGGDIRLLLVLPVDFSPVASREFLSSAIPGLHPLPLMADSAACDELIRQAVAEPSSDEARAVVMSEAGALSPLFRSAFFAAAATRLGGGGRLVDFVCAAGDVGSAHAAWAAKRMGFPVGRIHVVDALGGVAGLFDQGRIAAGEDGARSAGLERLYFEAVEGQGLETARAMRALATTGTLDLPPKARGVFLADFGGLEVEGDHGVAASLAVANEAGRALDGPTAGAAILARDVAKASRRPVVVMSGPRLADRDEAGVAPDLEHRLPATIETLRLALTRPSEINRAA